MTLLKEGCKPSRQTLIFVIFYLMFMNVSAQQRPRILEHPADAIAAREEPLTLNCKATGRPHPDIIWYHNGLPLVPSERRVILPEGSLFFLRVVYNKREQDTGIYWCEAKSTAGIAVSNNVTLQIAHLKDEFRTEPENTTALVGGDVTLECIPPRGIPEPSVLWYKDKKLIDLRGKRLSLIASGSLHIAEVLVTDSGIYECTAQNMAGRKDTKPAVLKVLTPPRVIRGPSDIEVIEGDRIDIPCEIDGDPKPLSSWQREGKPFPEGRARILLDNTLRIEDVRADDEGKYTCKALNDGGNITISININVFAMPRIIETGSEIVSLEEGVFKMTCRATGRPSSIIVWDKLFFEINSSDLSSELIHKKNLWNVVSENIGQDVKTIAESSTLNDTLIQHRNNHEPEFEVKVNGELLVKNIDLKQTTWYMCAAINEAGSDVKSMFLNITSKNNSEIEYNKSKEYWTNSQNIYITSIIPVSSNELDVLWDFAQTSIIESDIYVYYRPIQINEPEGRLLFRDYLSVKTTFKRKNCRISNLKPYTNYEIFVTFPKGLSNSISNLRKGKTLDGPPSAPPTDIRVGVINNTAAYVRWSPPPKHLINGELTGYKIQIKSNVTNKLLGQMSLNATTQSVVINSLSPGGRYIARVAPLTAGGLGPYSYPAPLHIDTSIVPHGPKSDPTLVSWSISWMSGIVFSIFGFFLISASIFTVIWAKRNKRNMKSSFPSQNLSSTQIDKEQTIWVKNSSSVLKQTYTYVVPPPPPLLSTAEYAEVSSIKITKINNTNSQLEPYATVTLADNNCRTVLEECIQDKNNDYYQTKLTSDDSYQKCDISPSSSGYNAPIRMPINICDMLPPPPNQPEFIDINKPFNYNMTIRTNPTALSPRLVRRQNSNLQLDWAKSQLPPPIPSFPHNWIQERQDHFDRISPCWYSHQQQQYDSNVNHSNVSLVPNQFYSESIRTPGTEECYDSGSVLYDQLLRDKDSLFFSEVGEPTEKYYRNVNMEFYNDFEPSTPPPPCPSETLSRKNINYTITSKKNNKEKTYKAEQYSNINNKFNCEPAHNNVFLDNKEVGFVKKQGNECYDNNCSSDENEVDVKTWKQKPRRSRSRSNENRFINEK